MIIPRFAKMGSTKLDILSKMYDELMSDPQVKPRQLALDYCTCQHTIGSYPNFASIPAVYHNALVEHYIYEGKWNEYIPEHIFETTEELDFWLSHNYIDDNMWDISDDVIAKYRK